jgi:hypothetical protein
MAAVTCGRGEMIVADYEGVLHFVSRPPGGDVSSFKAYAVRVTHAMQMRHHNTLVTVGVSAGAECRARVPWQGAGTGCRGRVPGQSAGAG